MAGAAAGAAAGAIAVAAVPAAGAVAGAAAGAKADDLICLQVLLPAVASVQQNLVVVKGAIVADALPASLSPAAFVAAAKVLLAPVLPTAAEELRPCMSMRMPLAVVARWLAAVVEVACTQVAAGSKASCGSSSSS